MRVSIAIIAALFLLALASDLTRTTARGYALFGGEQVETVKVDGGERLTRTVPGSLERERLLTEITVSGPATLRVGDDDYTLEKSSAYCDADPDARLRCRVLWSREGAEPIQMSLKASSGAVEVGPWTDRVISKKSISALDSADYRVVLLILVGAIPIVWLLHRHREASQWFIVGVAAAILLYVQPLFSIWLFAILALIFVLGRHIRQHRKAIVVLMLAVLLILMVLLFKIVLPGIRPLFAEIGAYDLILPLGISYFVIRLINVILHWYRGALADFTFREFLCLVVFPPTLAAGPIVLANEFRNRRIEHLTRDDAIYGVSRICFGIGKKLFICDLFLFPLVTELFADVSSAPGEAPTYLIISLLVANFAFAYLDFSAYSDIAIGLGRLYGYRVPENFNFPFLQANIRDFWKTWHMSLSTWAMQTIYFPTAIRTKSEYIPLFMTMIAIGCWHSLGLSWLLWGTHHACGLAFMVWLARHKPKFMSAPWYVTYARPLRVALTLYFVSLGHSFVLYSDVSTALVVYARGWAALVGYW